MMNWDKVIVKVKDEDAILIIVALQQSPAHGGGIGEPGTDAVHHCLNL